MPFHRGPGATPWAGRLNDCPEMRRIDLLDWNVEFRLLPHPNPLPLGEGIWVTLSPASPIEGEEIRRFVRCPTTQTA